MGLLARMDRQGRILIPASIRKKLKTRLFIVEAEEDKIVLRPVEPVSLTSLFDSIPVDDVEDFTDTHELRRALTGEGQRQ